MSDTMTGHRHTLSANGALERVSAYLNERRMRQWGPLLSTLLTNDKTMVELRSADVAQLVAEVHRLRYQLRRLAMERNEGER